MRDSIQRQRTIKKRKKINNVLLIVSIVLCVAGVALLLVDPIKNKMRKKAVNDGLEAIESQMQSTDPTAEMTFVVPINGNEIEGEGYDYFGDEIEGTTVNIEEELSASDGYATLNGIGIIDIESIDCRIPVWDEATVLSLRYGAGHYQDSVMPGENGNCSILAHHMRETGSMFNRLDEVQTGDIVRLEMIDGTVYEYEVDSISVISAEELDARIAGDYFSDPRITLVTCTYTAEGKMRLIVSGFLTDDQE
jgi:LPXTG-site transpeptidase (sortase) family protein